jgi:hypothetical protein
MKFDLENKYVIKEPTMWIRYQDLILHNVITTIKKDI